MPDSSTQAYWQMRDIEAKPAEVPAAGATVKEPAHGNVVGLLEDR